MSSCPSCRGLEKKLSEAIERAAQDTQLMRKLEDALRTVRSMLRQDRDPLTIVYDVIDPAIDSLNCSSRQERLGETGSPQRSLAADKSPRGSPAGSEPTSTGAKASEERVGLGGEVAQRTAQEDAAPGFTFNCIQCGEEFYTTRWFKWCSDVCQRQTLRKEKKEATQATQRHCDYAECILPHGHIESCRTSNASQLSVCNSGNIPTERSEK